MPEPYSRAHKAAKMAKEYGADLPTSSGVEQESISEAYSHLPSPPEESGRDIGLDSSPHLPPWPVALHGAAVGATVPGRVSQSFT